MQASSWSRRARTRAKPPDPRVGPLRLLEQRLDCLCRDSRPAGNVVRDATRIAAAPRNRSPTQARPQSHRSQLSRTPILPANAPRLAPGLDRDRHGHGTPSSARLQPVRVSHCAAGFRVGHPKQFAYRLQPSCLEPGHLDQPKPISNKWSSRVVWKTERRSPRAWRLDRWQVLGRSIG
jgi:hypothetical protein